MSGAFCFSVNAANIKVAALLNGWLSKQQAAVAVA